MNKIANNLMICVAAACTSVTMPVQAASDVRNLVVSKPARPDDAVPSHTAMVTNDQGISAGYRWRHQVVDKYTGKVVRNVVWKADGLLSGGDLRINGGRLLDNANSEIKSFQNDTSDQEGSGSHYHQLPAQWRVGHKESFRFKEAASGKDGSA